MGLGREFNLFWFTAEAKKLIHTSLLTSER